MLTIFLKQDQDASDETINYKLKHKKNESGKVFFETEIDIVR